MAPHLFAQSLPGDVDALGDVEKLGDVPRGPPWSDPFKSEVPNPAIGAVSFFLNTILTGTAGGLARLPVGAGER